MPVRDDDLERALREAAPRIDTEGVLDRVSAKRARRRSARAARMTALTLVAIIVTIGGVVLLARDEDRARVTTPATRVPASTPIALDRDEGYLRGPLTLSGDLVSVAAYDRDGRGGYDFPPSRIVRFDPDTLEVVDRVDLKAEILDVADGVDGVRWAITRNPDPDGPTTAGVFLKRIAPDGAVQSFSLPPGTQVTGPVSTVNSWAIIPTSTGTLVFDGVVVRGGSPQQTPAGDAPDPPPAVRRALSGSRDAAFVRVNDNTVLATSNGRLLRIHVDR